MSDLNKEKYTSSDDGRILYENGKPISRIQARTRLNVYDKSLMQTTQELSKRRDQIDAIREVLPCQADRDGDCNWEKCPQKARYLSGCPLYDWDHDEEGIDRRPKLPS